MGSNSNKTIIQNLEQHKGMVRLVGFTRTPDIGHGGRLCEPGGHVRIRRSARQNLSGLRANVQNFRLGPCPDLDPAIVP